MVGGEGKWGAHGAFDCFCDNGTLHGWISLLASHSLVVMTTSCLTSPPSSGLNHSFVSDGESSVVNTAHQPINQSQTTRTQGEFFSSCLIPAVCVLKHKVRKADLEDAKKNWFDGSLTLTSLHHTGPLQPSSGAGHVLHAPVGWHLPRHSHPHNPTAVHLCPRLGSQHARSPHLTLR